MAEKRMFSQEIVGSDAFLSLPATSQNLYFHLNMAADDDGFVSNTKTIILLSSSKKEDLENLKKENFILDFGNVILIKHWKINNFIRSDRKKQTNYTDELKLIFIKENGSYSLKTENNKSEWQPNDNQMTTKCQSIVGIDKYRLDKIRLEENRIEEIRVEERREDDKIELLRKLKEERKEMKKNGREGN